MSENLQERFDQGIENPDWPVMPDGPTGPTGQVGYEGAPDPAPDPDQPAIHCRFTELADPVALIPNPRNPNTHSPKQLDLLARTIKGNGWRSPIVVSNRSGFVVKGHGRLLAAMQAGFRVVPVERQDYASEALEWADLVADNRLAELSDWDDAKLNELLSEMPVIETELTGFDLDALNALQDKLGASGAGDSAAPPEEFQEFDEGIDTDYRCPKCGYEWSGKTK